MAYATTEDVLARAGRIAGAFTVAGERPNLADIEQFLADTATEIDAAVRSRGFDPASLEQTAKDGFRDLNAYGALLRALGGIVNPPGDVVAAARGMWEDAIGTPGVSGSIARGTFSVIAAIEAGQEGGGPGATAGSLWDEEPEYGSVASVQAEAAVLADTNLAPAFSRGQKL